MNIGLICLKYLLLNNLMARKKSPQVYYQEEQVILEQNKSVRVPDQDQDIFPCILFSSDPDEGRYFYFAVYNNLRTVVLVEMTGKGCKISQEYLVKTKKIIADLK